MTFRYPIEIAKDLVSVTHQFSKHAMEIHGIGLVCTFPLNFPVLPFFLLPTRQWELAFGL